MIEAREVLTGKVNVGTKEIEPPLIDLEATPTKEVQEFNHEGEYGYDKVKVNPIPDEYIIPNGELNINANGEVDVTTFRMARVGVYTPPTLQDKSIEIIENGTTNITADEGFDGLGNVEVNTNVIKRGMIIDEYDENGKPTKVSFNGMSKIYDYAMGNSSLSTAQKQIGVNVKHIEMDDTVETIGEYAFGQCRSLESVRFSKSLNSIGRGAFVSCMGLILKTLPDSVTSLGYNAFAYITNITQMSLLNVTALYNSASFPFQGTSLKALWLGSQIPDSGFDNNTFSSNKNTLTTIFINLPRATIETYTYYSVKWGATNATIICNDDEGWMTKEEFDAIDWATYTG